MLVVLGVQTAAAAVSPVRRGAWYRASGRQPHFSGGSFNLEFQVTGNGRRVTALGLAGPYDVQIPCSGAPVSDLDEILTVGSARIKKNGTFRAVVPLLRYGPADTTVTVSGRFLSGGRVQGTLRYRGTGAYSGCNANGTWKGHAWPLQPPVQHFVGKTDQGTVVTFERTIEARPRVTLFNFGAVTGTTDLAGGARCTPGDPVATRGLSPPWDPPFALPVRHGGFSGTSYGGASTLDISGDFATNSRASGSIDYDDEGDCAIHASWTAHLVR